MAALWAAGGGADEAGDMAPLRLTFVESLDLAFENSQWRSVSRLEVEIAAAQHRQALSTYWPQVVGRSLLTRRDDDPIFIFPEETDNYLIPLGDQLVNLPVTVAEKRIALMDATHFQTTAELVYPLYTGGLRRSLKRQTEAGMAAAKQVVRRTDLQVTYDVKRMYYGALLARKLVDIGAAALVRLEVTLELAERLYQRGSGQVKKTDYLKNKVFVENLRSVVVRLRGNYQLALAALTNTMGLDWRSRIEPVESDIPYQPYAEDIEQLVDASYRFNPDWARLKAGLAAAAGKVGEAQSGRLPKIALIGNLQFIANAHDAGIVGSQEEKSWVVGIGMEIPVFDGYLTRHRIREARTRVEKLESQKVLLRQGLALQVKAFFIELLNAQNQEAAAAAALDAATDNLRLNERAYQNELVEIQDLIEAQLLAAFSEAVYHKIRYDHLVSKSQLELVIGTEIKRLVQ